MMLSDQLNNNNQWIKWKTRNRALYITTDARRRRRCLRCCSIRNEMIFEALKKIQQTIKNINHPKNGAHQSKFSLWAMNYILRRLHLYSFVGCVLFFIVKWKKKIEKVSMQSKCTESPMKCTLDPIFISFSLISKSYLIHFNFFFMFFFLVHCMRVCLEWIDETVFWW